MPTVIFHPFDQAEQAVTIDVPQGMSVMNAAVQNGLEGIVGECGGCCACATCHVYVDERFLDRLAPMGDVEADLLTVTASERKPNSRLSCQIAVTDELDGLVVYLPESQLL